jgi:hypothetical protein
MFFCAAVSLSNTGLYILNSTFDKGAHVVHENLTFQYTIADCQNNLWNIRLTEEH